MGHFGRKPVRLAWLIVVWPALVLNYFGQGALLIARRRARSRIPSSRMAPQAAAAAAGAARHRRDRHRLASHDLGRVLADARGRAARPAAARARAADLRATTRGQIYVPAANLFLFVAWCCSCSRFRSSSALASAYGVAVMGTMFITTLLGVAGRARACGIGRWWRVAPLFGAVPHRRPRVPRRQRHQDRERRLGAARLRRRACSRCSSPGATAASACAPSSSAARCRRRSCRSCWRQGQGARHRGVPREQLGFVPTALLRNLEHNKVHHEQIVILHIEIQRMPRVDPLCRVTVEELHAGRVRRARAIWLHGDART